MLKGGPGWPRVGGGSRVEEGVGRIPDGCCHSLLLLLLLLSASSSLPYRAVLSLSASARALQSQP